MVTKKQKQKNIKDLEYNHLLNKQSVALVLVGTAIITTLLSDKLPQNLNLSKTELIIFLLLVGIGFLLYFRKRLDEKIEEITKI